MARESVQVSKEATKIEIPPSIPQSVEPVLETPLEGTPQEEFPLEEGEEMQYPFGEGPIEGETDFSFEEEKEEAQ